MKKVILRGSQFVFNFPIDTGFVSLELEVDEFKIYVR